MGGGEFSQLSCDCSQACIPNAIHQVPPLPGAKTTPRLRTVVEPATVAPMKLTLMLPESSSHFVWNRQVWAAFCQRSLLGHYYETFFFKVWANGAERIGSQNCAPWRALAGRLAKITAMQTSMSSDVFSFIRHDVSNVKGYALPRSILLIEAAHTLFPRSSMTFRFEAQVAQVAKYANTGFC